MAELRAAAERAPLNEAVIGVHYSVAALNSEAGLRAAAGGAAGVNPRWQSDCSVKRWHVAAGPRRDWKRERHSRRRSTRRGGGSGGVSGFGGHPRCGPPIE